MKDGREIRLRVEPGADPIEVRNFLYGTGLGIICHQRSIFPLHGSCLSLGGRAVIFSGHSGAGKSTLAAALTQRGHAMLSDDVCALEPTTEGWSVRPAFPRVKLLPQSLEILPDLKQSGVHAALQGKYHFRFENVSAFSRKTTPLAAIYFLERAKAGEPTALLRKTGMEALRLVQQQVFRRRAGELLGRRAALFAASGAIVSNVPVYVLRRAFDLRRLQETIDRLEEAHEAVPAQNGFIPV
ncbi:HPr kinase/phosphorylase [Terriglobus sp. YAF25]|uniref:HPr kinase/phosphorylase n=1 Tax=Terriglobus sp. YAF25 TaxID=3233080 RepID=UPI003F9C048A